VLNSNLPSPVITRPNTMALETLEIFRQDSNWFLWNQWRHHKKLGIPILWEKKRLQSDFGHQKKNKSLHSPLSRDSQKVRLQHISASKVIHPEGVLLVHETKATHQRQRWLLRAVADAVLEEKGRGQVDVTWWAGKPHWLRMKRSFFMETEWK